MIEGAVLSHVASGCNPVRVAPSQDGKIVWVTVRGDEKIHENLIHVYDAELLRTNPEKAYLSSFNSNGESPIGIVTFSEDRYLAVSNANRFQVKDQNKKIVPTNVSIFDISNRESPKLITSLPGGGFPRDITTSYDSKSIYVAMWDEGRFKQITYKLK